MRSKPRTQCPTPHAVRLPCLGALPTLVCAVCVRHRNSRLYASDGPLLSLARRHAGDALTLLDVGSYVPNIVARFDWIPTKVATDIQVGRDGQRVWNGTRGIAFVRGDFLKLDFGYTPFDLVTCSQVLRTHIIHRMLPIYYTVIYHHTRPSTS